MDRLNRAAAATAFAAITALAAAITLAAIGALCQLLLPEVSAGPQLAMAKSAAAIAAGAAAVATALVLPIARHAAPQAATTPLTPTPREQPR